METARKKCGAEVVGHGSTKSKLPAALVVLVRTGVQAFRSGVISMTHIRLGPPVSRHQRDPSPLIVRGVSQSGGLSALRRFNRPPLAHFPRRAVTGSVPAKRRRMS